MTMQCATKDDVELTGVPLYEIRTEVMSASARICVVGGDAGIAEDARARLLELAGRWDSAAADSEIGRINTGSGAPVPASPETVLLVGLALQAARETRGGYDPRALPRVLDGVGGFGREDSTTTWIERFVVDPRSGTVGIPPCAALDLGGIDRGLAADLVVADALDAGAYGVCVDVGGHVRAAGAAPCRNGWVLAVEHPLAPQPVASLRLRGGAVGTSARTAYTGRASAQETPGLVAVTVVGASAWHAKAIARAALRAGYRRGQALVESAGGAALFCFTDGTCRPTTGWWAFAD